MALLKKWITKSLIIGFSFSSTLAYGNGQTPVDWEKALKIAEAQILTAAISKYKEATDLSIKDFTTRIQSTTADTFVLTFSFRIIDPETHLDLKCDTRITALTEDGLFNPEHMLENCGVRELPIMHGDL